jgi:hypothetical protein
MGTASSDRARLRTDLRELAKLATPDHGTNSPAPHTFQSADSSGYVDLSAFSATDDGNMDGWVERELAAGGGRARGGAVLTPGSMAPVAMSALVDATPDETSAGSRKRGWIYTGLGVVGVAAVAALALALARHPPPFLKNAPQPPVAAAAVAAPPTAAPTETASTPVPAPSVAAAPMAVTVSAPDPGLGAKKHPGAKHARGASAAPAAVAAARPAQLAPTKVSIPAAHTGGGDSLMDMMRASVNSPKKVY